ncbi:MAG: filamentous hemagglutinin N-terminal domain-containing protein, partial [bacterium]|nr:filamentous hemagglutinin N-terminal domain-containing protein [bacterium]
MGTSTMNSLNRHFHGFRPLLLATLIAACYPLAHAAPPVATALPTGGQIVAGQGSIAQAGTAMTVNQNSATMIANWQTFNIGQNASVNFVQPSASAVALNQVLSANPSQIFGSLTANGRVFLVNPSGVYFGPSARVDVGGLTASALNLSNADFLAGRYKFAAGSGAVSNLGEIAAREGGFVALVGATVDNAGKVSANAGQVALAAGQGVTLDITANGLVSVKVDTAGNGARADNTGTVIADGGRVWMTAKSAAPMLAAAVNQSGIVRANSIATKNGEIWIEGTGGNVRLAGTTEARGAAEGETGGRIVATGDGVTVASGAQVDASGMAGGGSVNLGGGWQGKDAAIVEARSVTVERGATIAADATASGDGGTVVAWSGEITRMDGSISARGAGAGKGGQVETSSRGALGVRGSVDASAPSGRGGSWLLDPNDITITGVATDVDVDPTNAASPVNYAPGAAVSVYNSSIDEALTRGVDVTLTTGAGGNIAINANISKTGGGTANLTFDALNDITLSTGVNVASTFGVLNVNFGTSANSAAGTAIIQGNVSTNGGSVVFNKVAQLVSATPVSTKILASGDAGLSGSITFEKAVVLNNQASSTVTLDTQAAKSGATYTGTGGNILFKDSITSFDITLPQQLILTTTGKTTGGTNDAGSVTFGDALAATTTEDFVGTVANPLGALIITGPTYTFLNTSQINLKAPSGNLLTFSTNHPSYVPKLVLGANATTISVTGVSGGGGVDSADYTQSSFDIVTSSLLTNPSLTVQSERSIQVIGSSTQSRKITGDYYNTGTGLVAGNKALIVTLKPSQFAGISSGAIYLDNARIDSYGANVKLGDAGNLAYGVATEQNTDGVRIFESSIYTGGGNLDIWGRAPTETNLGAVSSAGGIGVHIYGLGTLSTSNGTSDSTGILTINGGVTTASSSAAKDAVVIGRGGSATATLQTDNGALAITGDASTVTGATAGASYTGIDISASAMIRSKGGAITLTGSGGGGSASNVGENYGIKLKDTDTQIVSTTGNILLTGLTGGKTTSYGIYASGDDMALGQERDTTTDHAVTGGTFTGNIDMVADTMKFVNSSTSRLRITGARSGADLTTGQLNIRPYHDATIQIGGTEPSPPSPDSGTLAAPTKPLYLASSLFSGTNAVVIEGFGDITIGRYGVAPTESTKTLTVAGATTVNNSLNLRMLGAGGNIAVNAPLTVQKADGSARTLAMHVQAGVAGTGAITSDKLRLIGSGDVLLTGSSFVGTLAAGGPGTGDGVTYDGNITLANAQTLTVGQVTSESLGATATSTGIVTANNKNVTLSTTGGDITVKRDITAGSGTVSLVASAGAVNENNTDVVGGPIVTADKLRVGARDTSTLVSTNVVNTLAGAITGSGQNFNFRNANALIIGTVPVGGNVDGFTLNAGNAAIKLVAGGLTQTKPVITGSNTTGSFFIDAPGSVILEETGNDFGKFAATLTGGAGTLSVVDKNTLQLGTSGTASVSIPGSGGSTVAMGGTNIAAGGYTTKLWSGATGTGGVNEVDGATVTAAKLLVKANDNSTMVNDNVIATDVSAVVTGSGKTLYFTENDAILVGSVANTTSAAPDPTNGILATGNTVVLNAKTGDITQQANTLGDIIGGSLLLKADIGNVTLQNATNDVGTLAAVLGTGGTNFSYRDANALIVGSLTPATGITPGTLAPVLGAAIDGITTTSGTIDLYTLADSLTVNKSIIAGGASTIDLRATGGTSDVAINDSATVKSVGGAQIQIAAGQDISTNTNNGTGSEIETTGSVLLQAGRAIGVDGKRIEMTEVSTLAATAASDMWLRKLGTADDLTIGTVTAIAQGDTVTTSGGVTSTASAVAVADRSGLTTTANDGKITLTTQGGDLTITQAVTAHGTGYVDIRTANAGNLGDIAINNGATISSTSGTVQLIGGSTITTDSTNGTAVEINTEGAVLLEAGESIGTNTNRIELRNASTVVGRTLGRGLNNDLWLRKLSGATGGGTNHLTVGRVDGVNTGNGAAAEAVASTGTT